MTQERTGKEVWEHTKELLKNFRIAFGAEGSKLIYDDPNEMGSRLACYKFASKMACKKGRVLELKCGEGLGSAILGENVAYTGIDSNADAIAIAKKNFPMFTFIEDDSIGKKYGSFEAVVCLKSSHDHRFFETVIGNLSIHGIAVIYGMKSIAVEMKSYFHQVFPFAISDQTVHMGTSNELICVGSHAKNR